MKNEIINCMGRVSSGLIVMIKDVNEEGKKSDNLFLVSYGDGEVKENVSILSPISPDTIHAKEDSIPIVFNKCVYFIDVDESFEIESSVLSKKVLSRRTNYIYGSVSNDMLNIIRYKIKKYGPSSIMKWGTKIDIDYTEYLISFYFHMKKGDIKLYKNMKINIDELNMFNKLILRNMPGPIYNIKEDDSVEDIRTKILIDLRRGVDYSFIRTIKNPNEIRLDYALLRSTRAKYFLRLCSDINDIDKMAKVFRTNKLHIANVLRIWIVKGYIKAKSEILYILDLIGDNSIIDIMSES